MIHINALAPHTRAWFSGMFYLALVLVLLAACGTDTSTAEPTDDSPTDMPSLAATPAAVADDEVAPSDSTTENVDADVAYVLERPTLPSQPTAVASPTPSPPPDPLFNYRRAMRSAFVDDIAAQAHRPHYHLRLWLDPDAGTLNGVVRVEFTNMTGVPLHDIVFRLYPNLVKDMFGEPSKGTLDVSDVSVDGTGVAPVYVAERTALQVPLSLPLAPDAATTLVLTYTATIDRWSDGTLILPEYYPMLAVHDDSGWRMDVPRFSDDTYAETAFYTVEVNLPTPLDVVATGTIDTIYNHNNDTRTFTIYSGPVRDFALIAGTFDETMRQAGLNNDIDVRVFKAHGSELDNSQIARVAAAALTTYEQRFGPYPYRELDLYMMPGAYNAGWTHTGLIFLVSGSDDFIDIGLRHIAAHEVAHQWWFSLIGSDIYTSAWLDESLAQYSAIVYAEDMEGSTIAEALWQREVEPLYEDAVQAGDMLIGLPIDAYPDANVYYTTLYGKGAVFVKLLRDTLGDDAFFGALQRYVQHYRYGRATTQDAKRIFEETSGQDLSDMFATWVSPIAGGASTGITSDITSTMTMSPSNEAVVSQPPIETLTTTDEVTTDEVTTDVTIVESSPSVQPADSDGEEIGTGESEDTLSIQTQPPVEEAENLTLDAVPSASSVLLEETSQGTMRYDPMFAVDANLETAWVEGVPGPGDGQWLDLRFGEPVTITHIGMDVGYDVDDAIFYANNRVQSVTLLFSDGTMQQATFADTRDMQYVAIAPVWATSVTVVIENVYAGSAYDDTPIAEIEVWGSH